jgi:hypothetical protein
LEIFSASMGLNLGSTQRRLVVGSTNVLLGATQGMLGTGRRTLKVVEPSSLNSRAAHLNSIKT